MKPKIEWPWEDDYAPPYEAIGAFALCAIAIVGGVVWQWIGL